jgi:uncharacterized protein YdaU (DUF1376 family)
MNRPWMPLYVGDYLGDTGHLTTTQHGAYLLLMMHYWRKGELPDDDTQLAKITRLPLKLWQDYRPILQGFFYDGWKHKRIDKELRKMMEVSEKRSKAGQLGGIGSALSKMKNEAKSLSKHALSQANAKQVVSKAQANVDHSHSQEKIKSEEVSSGGSLATAPLEGARRSPPYERPKGSPTWTADALREHYARSTLGFRPKTGTH